MTIIQVSSFINQRFGVLSFLQSTTKDCQILWYFVYQCLMGLRKQRNG